MSHPKSSQYVHQGMQCSLVTLATKFCQDQIATRGPVQYAVLWSVKVITRSGCNAHENIKQSVTYNYMCMHGWVAWDLPSTLIKLGAYLAPHPYLTKVGVLLETTGVLLETTWVLMRGSWVLQVRITARAGAIFTSLTCSYTPPI